MNGSDMHQITPARIMAKFLVNQCLTYQMLHILQKRLRRLQLKVMVSTVIIVTRECTIPSLQLLMYPGTPNASAPSLGFYELSAASGHKRYPMEFFSSSTLSQTASLLRPTELNVFLTSGPG